MTCSYCEHAEHPRQRLRRKGAKTCAGCQTCRNAVARARAKRLPEEGPRRSREQRRRLWDAALAAYGNMCSCCGEQERMFLTLDHLNDDGKEVRKRIGPQVNKILTDLKRRGWPTDIDIKCFNCNSGRYRNGGECPHVAQRVPCALEVATVYSAS